MSQESENDISEMEGLVQKRRREFSTEDESLNLSKYRKLTTEQKLNDLKKEVTASDTSSYESEEEEDDESYVDGDKKGSNDEVVPDSELENSQLSNETNTPSTMEQEHQNSMEIESESDVDSLEVSATEELNLLENIRKPIEKVQRLAFISATYRMSGRKMNTSQFSCNADLTVNGDLAHNEAINRTVKKRNSALYDNDKADERVEANGPNGCEETGSGNTELEKAANAECINTQDLADTQIMDSESIAALECMDTAKDIQPQNIKSEKALQVIVAENVETFSNNTYSDSETMVPQNTGSEHEETMSENIDSGYKVSSCEDTSMNNIEPTKVTKVEYLNTQDLPDTQMMNSESIAELDYMDTENILKSDNIKTEIASQVTVPANVDPQNVENFSDNIDSESRKSVLENIDSENGKAVSEDIDSGYENAASEKVDSENEKTLAEEVEKEPAVIKNVENSETVLRNINSENTVVDAVDTTNTGSITMTSNSENMPVLLTDSNSNNDAQTESMDVETSVIENTETNISMTEQSYVNESFASDNSNRPQSNENEQETAIRNLLSHANFDIITDDSQVVSEVIIPDNAEVYTEPNNSSNPSTYEHSYQDPNTSGVVEEVITDASRANSVSDLNLAQLVLSMKQDIQELCKKVEKQGNVLEAVVNANEINLTPLFAQTFQEKYNLQIPFTKIEDFDKFNQDLAKNTRFCNEFITSLCSYIDNNVTLAKNILNMLRKYMSKELATLYTASKATGNKMVLKDTLFCKCLLQATKLTIRNGLLPLEHEKAFMKNLGLVVSGAKNWVTHEDDRRRSSQS